MIYSLYKHLIQIACYLHDSIRVITECCRASLVKNRNCQWAEDVSKTWNCFPDGSLLEEAIRRVDGVTDDFSRDVQAFK